MKTVQSGYVIVDCKGVNLLAGEKVTVDGIFDASKNAINTGKMILAANCQYGEGVPMTPIPVFAIKEGDYFIFTASILQIVVEEDDGVTVRSLIQ